MTNELNCGKTPRRFYTYIHTREDSNSVFYVGKGTGRRAWETRRSAHWAAVSKKGYKVDLLGHFDSEAEAYAHELFLVACLRQLGAPLVNKTDGGAWRSGCTHTADVCAAMSLARKGAASVRFGKPGTMLGKKMPAGFAALARSINTGKVLSAETKAKISAANKGHRRNTKGVPRTLSPEALEKMRLGAKNMVRAPLSVEARMRISAAKKAYWAARKEQ